MAVAVVVGPASFWDAELAHQGGRWELAAGAWIVALGFLVAAMARSSRGGALGERLAVWLERRPAWQLPAAAAGGWFLFWALFHAVTDPGWIPSGIDWHDFQLDTYGLLFDQPEWYSAWRYPLYGAICAVVVQVTGLEIEVAGQLVSRASAALTAVPLYYLGRQLFGRSAAVAGIALLLTLATYRMHTDAMTAYPLYMLLAVGLTAGLVAAVRGGILPYLVVGLGLGGLLAADCKGLLGALAGGSLALPLALAMPWRWLPSDGEQPAALPAMGVGRRLLLGAGLRLARLLLIAAPIALSYGWTASVPVTSFTLEEQSINYLVPGGRENPELGFDKLDGYLWGHLKGLDTVPRTLARLWEASRREDMAEQRARQQATSLQRLGMDYPAVTWRLLVAVGVGLLVPLVAWRRPRRERLRLLLQLAAVLSLVGSVLPSVRVDYQERYLVHAVVVLPILLMGGVDGLYRLLVGSGTPGRRLLRGLAVLLCAVLLLAWPAGAFSLWSLEARLNPVAKGGAQEVEVDRWGREQLGPGDVLLDTSWMMTAVLLPGERAVARAQDTYPPGGGPWPNDIWRLSKPLPERDSRGGISGQAYALVEYITAMQDWRDGQATPLDQVERRMDSPLGRRVVNDPSWERVFETTDTMVVIYRYRGEGLPDWWRLGEPGAVGGRKGSRPPRKPHPDN